MSFFCRFLAVLWIACALYFSIRIAQTGDMRDSLWAGFFVGLAGATKYPAALVGFPVAVACWLYRPRLRQQALWTAGAVSVAVFALTSPYVVIDAQSAWQDLALMGKVHLASAAAKTDIQSWRYYLQYGLRYGIGLLGLLALVVGLAWRPFARRREEWVVVAAFAVFFFLLMAAESIFMRYALPLAPMVALLWVRPLVALRPLLALLAALALVSEPLYASWQTRALLAGDDTREQVERQNLIDGVQACAVLQERPEQLLLLGQCVVNPSLHRLLQVGGLPVADVEVVTKRRDVQ